MPFSNHVLDTELGRWTFTEWEPDAADPLAWIVERIWDFDGWLANRRERVFPNGGVELIVQLDDPHHDVLESGTVATPTTCVTGVHTRALVVQSPARPCRVLGVRFQPPGAWAVLGCPLHMLTDCTADLTDVVGRSAAELAELCHDQPDAMARVNTVLAWLRGRAQDAQLRVDPAVRRVASCVAASGGRTPIGLLRGKVNLSEARLTAAFREQVGVTPKRYARIHRFRHALNLLASGPIRLAEAALESGYYDQPHMNADFRAMAGVTPREFLAATRYPNSVSLPEPAA